MHKLATSFATLALILFGFTTALAGHVAPEQGAVQIGSYTATFSLVKTGPTLESTSSDDGGRGGAVDVATWLLSNGETALTIDLETATFTAPCGWVKKLSAVQIADLFSEAAIREGVKRGFVECDLSPTNADTTMVYTQACIARHYSGGTTTVEDCPTLEGVAGAGQSVRGYTAICGSPDPTVTLVYSACEGATDCGGGFESTCR